MYTKQALFFMPYIILVCKINLIFATNFVIRNLEEGNLLSATNITKLW